MLNQFRKFLRDEEGVTAVEYALIAALIAVAIIIATQALGVSINDTFTTVGGKMDEANASAGGTTPP